MQIHLYEQFRHWLNAKNGQVYFYSDPHFNDGEMSYLRKNYIGDEGQVARINSKIGRNDTLVILGDVGDIDYVKKIRGYKVLITGNHDAGSSNYKRVVREKQVPCEPYLSSPSSNLYLQALKLFPNDILKQTGYISSIYSEARWKAIDVLKNEPDFVSLRKENITDRRALPQSWTVHYDNKLFDEVYDGPLFISPKLLLSHEPIDYPYALNIHGHDHSNWYRGPWHTNMCAEYIDYTPVSLKMIVSSGVLKDIQDIHRATIDKATIKNNQ